MHDDEIDRIALDDDDRVNAWRHEHEPDEGPSYEESLAGLEEDFGADRIAEACVWALEATDESGEAPRVEVERILRVAASGFHRIDFTAVVLVNGARMIADGYEISMPGSYWEQSEYEAEVDVRPLTLRERIREFLNRVGL